MLILGYLFAIRSERQLCRKIQVNLAYRRALFMMSNRRSGA
jgi:transposase